MTTIAYKDGIIAYDSQKTAGSLIVDGDYEKKQEKGGAVFFMAGSTHDFEAFIDSYLSGKLVEPENSLEAIVWDGRLWRCGGHKDEVFKCPWELDKPLAVGSGQDHAITAMDMGATAKEAVKWAMKRDTGTGGRIRNYRVKP